jgi:hypothetical protein
MSWTRELICSVLLRTQDMCGVSSSGVLMAIQELDGVIPSYSNSPVSRRPNLSNDYKMRFSAFFLGVEGIVREERLAGWRLLFLRTVTWCGKVCVWVGGEGVGWFLDSLPQEQGSGVWNWKSSASKESENLTNTTPSGSATPSPLHTLPSTHPPPDPKETNMGWKITREQFSNSQILLVSRSGLEAIKSSRKPRPAFGRYWRSMFAQLHLFGVSRISRLWKLREHTPRTRKVSQKCVWKVTGWKIS